MHITMSYEGFILTNDQDENKNLGKEIKVKIVDSTDIYIDASKSNEISTNVPTNEVILNKIDYVFPGRLVKFALIEENYEAYFFMTWLMAIRFNMIPNTNVILKIVDLHLYGQKVGIWLNMEKQ